MNAPVPAWRDMGLPGPLPEGESVLWHGRPDAASVARRVLHGRVLAVYFCALAVYLAGTAWTAGRTLAAVTMTIATVLAAGLAVLALVWLTAWLIARTTRYTITDQRIVMRVGMALPLSLNVPFAIVARAGLRIYPDGTGDLPVELEGGGRIGFLHLWPHARPWRLRRPEPMLRCIPDARTVAVILGHALGAGPFDSPMAARQMPQRQIAGDRAAALPTPVAA